MSDFNPDYLDTPEKREAVWQGIAAERMEEIDRLRSGIQAILDGNYPNPRKHRPGKCPHGMAYYEACENCVDDALSALITHVAGQGGTLRASDTPAAPSGGLDASCACGAFTACQCGVV